MLLREQCEVHERNARALLAFSRSSSIKLGSWRLDRKSISGVRNGEGDGNWHICAAAGDIWVRLTGRDSDELFGQISGFSHESEHDLALMVRDFVEDGSGSAEPRYSSDSDSGFFDPKPLVENVRFLKNSSEQNESSLSASVQSLLFSINEADLLLSCTGAQCNGRCIRQALVRHLLLSGYDAAICQSKWQASAKVPGGDHEFIDVILSGDGKSGGSPDRMIVETDFRSHFEIARAVECYEDILNALPVIYVGSIPRLKQYLQIMVDAAKFSLDQNSMPLPPWRTLPYLKAKWQSDYERRSSPDNAAFSSSSSDYDGGQCFGRLRRLKSSLRSEIASERPLKPIAVDKLRMEKKNNVFVRQKSVLRGH